MKKILYSSLFLLGLSLTAHAGVPVRRTLLQAQADGASLSVSCEGNGRFSVYSTSDGWTVLPVLGGGYCYAVSDGGTLRPSAVMAHDPEARSEDEQRFLREQGLMADEAAALLDARYPQSPLRRASRAAASTDDGLGRYGQSGGGVVESIGSPVVPVVMVSFKDRAFADTVTAQKLTRFFNEEGYRDERFSRGSVRDYFVAQSRGLFTPEFEVVAQVELSSNYAYYGEDGTDGSIDPKLSYFIQEALEKASATVDFSRFASADGVPLVAFVYAGPGQQSSFDAGLSDYIWAQFSQGRTYWANDEKVRINSYLVANEQLQEYGTSSDDLIGAGLDGIALFCHEFGHALGLPDFYYTGTNSAYKKQLKTMGYWSVMDYGQYYMNGYRPVGYTAYERSTLGWLDIMELDEPQFVRLYPYSNGQEGPEACVVRNPENENEYYILENRQRATWYPSAMGEGLFITHVDYDAEKWSANTVNNEPQHQRMTYVPADGKKDGNGTSGDLTLVQLMEGYAGDVFPGTTGATSFTDDTTPSATVYTASGKLGRPLYNITQHTDGTVSFSFRDASMTGIGAVEAGTEAAAPMEVYTIGGVRISSLEGAAPGVYVIRQGSRVSKVAVH